MEKSIAWFATAVLLLTFGLILPLSLQSNGLVRAADESKEKEAKKDGDQEKPADSEKQPAKTQEKPIDEPAPGSKKDPAGLTRLHPKLPVWLDVPNKRVVMVGEVCLREGPLEMFACVRKTKEHESILTVTTPIADYEDPKFTGSGNPYGPLAFIVHAGLMASGAEFGNPAQFDPDYQPARGSEVDITLFWTDEKGERHRARAQDWVRNHTTKKAMTHPWVFGGSRFYVDEKTGEKVYMAEEGDFICLSNFPTAMLDLPVASPQDNNALVFEAITENIPPKGTKVTIVLTPKPGSFKKKPEEKKPEPAKEPAAEPKKE
jgi:hypothetical protein